MSITPSNAQGKFYVFEGLDGSGKTTMAKFLETTLTKRLGQSCLLLREPGGTPFGEAIRDIVKSDLSKGVHPDAMTMLINASRRHLIDTVVKPAIADGVHVIMDRFTLSTMVYQHESRHVSYMNQVGTDNILPDLIFILDVDYQTAKKRTVGRGLIDHWEAAAESLFEQRRAILAKFSEMYPSRVCVIDGSLDRDVVESMICQRLNIV